MLITLMNSGKRIFTTTTADDIYAVTNPTAIAPFPRGDMLDPCTAKLDAIMLGEKTMQYNTAHDISSFKLNKCSRFAGSVTNNII